MLVERGRRFAEGDAELARAERMALIVADEIEEAVEEDLVDHEVALHSGLHLTHPRHVHPTVTYLFSAPNAKWGLIRVRSFYIKHVRNFIFMIFICMGFV